MNRREYLKLNLGVAGGLLFPGNLLFSSSFSAKGNESSYLSQFNHKLLTNPELLGWQGTDRTSFISETIPIIGKIPAEINGNFYRNGPAKHDFYGSRYHHWFDGDGMVHKFGIKNSTVVHVGKIVNTEKIQDEVIAGKRLYPAFGTGKFLDVAKLGSPAKLNPANTSIMSVNNQLFALWEGGNAYELEPDTLATVGSKAWSSATNHESFGAHYKVDSNGTIWNIGYSPVSDKIIIWHIGKDGKLITAKFIKEKKAPMMHDFMITDKYIVLHLPPYAMNITSSDKDKSFIDYYEFDNKQATRIWVLDKNTLSIVNQFELPSQFVFHFANAWQQGDEIIYEAARYPDVAIMDRFGDIMKGEFSHAQAHLYRARLNLKTNKAMEEKVYDTSIEFPAVLETNIGKQYKQMIFLEQLGNDNRYFDTVRVIGKSSSPSNAFSYSDQLAEEHILVEGTKNNWVIGTSLNYLTAKTHLNIFNANNLADGPVAIAVLPYVIPLGFHGKFVNNANV